MELNLTTLDFQNREDTINKIISNKLQTISNNMFLLNAFFEHNIYSALVKIGVQSVEKLERLLLPNYISVTIKNKKEIEKINMKENRLVLPEDMDANFEQQRGEVLLTNLETTWIQPYNVVMEEDFAYWTRKLKTKGVKLDILLTRVEAGEKDSINKLRMLLLTDREFLSFFIYYIENVVKESETYNQYHSVGRVKTKTRKSTK